MKMNIFFRLQVMTLLCLFALTLVQCGGAVSSAEAEATKAVLNGTQTNTTAPGTVNPGTVQPGVNPVDANNPQTPEVDPANATSIAFNEETFDFGTVKAGEKVTHLFKFKNTGTKPLTISNARGSCGCTVPEYPKTPIAPGEQGEIKVVFDSNGKNGAQTKYVTLNANTIPGETKLTIKADVIGTSTDKNSATPAPAPTK
jgi:hypothetical protein